MKIIAVVFLLITVALPVYASPCGGPCYTCTAQGTCGQRWWNDLDTFMVTGFPAQVERNPNGTLGLDVCFSSGGIPNRWCVDAQPPIMTLRQWCAMLMRLPTPPPFRPADPPSLYAEFQDAGICP